MNTREMIKYLAGRSALFVLLCMAVGIPANAHVSGTSLERTTEDGIRIDVGLSEETIVAGVPITFDFSLFEEETDFIVPFTYAWVRLIQDGRAVYAGALHRSPTGPTSMLYHFANPGTYTLIVRFEGDDETLAEEAFELSVAAESAGESRWPVAHKTLVDIAVVGLLLCAVVAWYVRKQWFV